MKIVITEFMDERAIEQLQARHEVVYDAALVDDAPRLLAMAPHADALIVRGRTQVRGELLAALGRCKVVGRLGVGLDNIDMAGCDVRGLQVIPARGANASSVAEYVIGSAMLLLRGAYRSTADVAAGAWPREALGRGHEIGGKTLGLVGFGSIGQLTATLARAFGMQVVAYDALLSVSHPVYAESGVRRVSLAELVPLADVISLHVPLVDSTRGLFGAARIDAMKPGAVLINTSRGGIVDEIALAAALRAGAIGGAALDVYAVEPLPATRHFVDCPNLLLTPHIAGVTVESNERVSFMIAEKVLEALQ